MVLVKHVDPRALHLFISESHFGSGQRPRPYKKLSRDNTCYIYIYISFFLIIVSFPWTFLTISRGSSEIVDFCHFEMFSTIFRGPSGIQQKCPFDIFSTIFNGSGIYRLCRDGSLQVHALTPGRISILMCNESNDVQFVGSWQ